MVPHLASLTTNPRSSTHCLAAFVAVGLGRFMCAGCCLVWCPYIYGCCLLCLWHYYWLHHWRSLWWIYYSGRCYMRLTTSLARPGGTRASVSVDVCAPRMPPHSASRTHIRCCSRADPVLASLTTAIGCHHRLCNCGRRYCGRRIRPCYCPPY
jgi:hypothetical protein